MKRAQPSSTPEVLLLETSERPALMLQKEGRCNWQTSRMTIEIKGGGPSAWCDSLLGPEKWHSTVEEVRAVQSDDGSIIEPTCRQSPITQCVRHNEIGFG